MHSRVSTLVVVCAFVQFIPALAYAATDEQLEQIKAQLKAQIDAEVGAIKKDYEGRIKTLEERINVLEADNTKLKGQSRSENQAQVQAAPDSKPTSTDEEIAALKERIAELEQARSERRDEMSGTSGEIASLKQRLAQLEGVATRAQTEVFPAMSERAAANTEAIRDINRKLQASATETRDIYHSELGPPFDLTKLYDLPRPFEYHGYLRSGYGMNGEGGKMEAFIAPGAFAKYRLGNEPETVRRTSSGK